MASATRMLHLIGLPHTQTVVEAMTVCAFTQKIVKFGEMMSSLGYGIVVYSGEHNDTECVEHVPVFTDRQQREWYGDHDPNLLPTIATWNSTDRPWREMNAAVIGELGKRLEPHDLILLIGGYAQKPIADAFPHHLAVEWAAGYEGWFSDFVCFESYAWRHHCYGRRGFNDGRWYDTVIPNYFRPQDFEVAEKKEDWLLFVGRVTRRKGPHIAADVAKAAGRKLLIAGSGVTMDGGRIVADGGQLVIEDDHVEYVGVVGVQERNELMGKAHALLAPTTYIEPFGAVAVEAQLCGTPALTTDWGAFPETVQEGLTGFRFRTLGEAVEAVEQAGDLDPETIRWRALKRYGLEAVGPMYHRWFKQLDTLWGDGWYEVPKFKLSEEFVPIRRERAAGVR